MFAVPGWSVAPNSMKVQTLKAAQQTRATLYSRVDGEHSGSKKRKRSSSSRSKNNDVNTSNFAALWETVIEGKIGGAAENRAKKQKITEASIKPNIAQAEPQERTQTSKVRERNAAAKHVIRHALGMQRPRSESQPSSKVLASEMISSEPQSREKSGTKAEKSKEEMQKQFELKSAEANGSLPSLQSSTSIVQPAILPKIASSLTPLQASMRQKLISARFRHLNQTLYTTPSARSLALFEENPEMFAEYHEGFRRQVEVWPENPVVGYIAQIKMRGKIQPSHRSKGLSAQADSEYDPLPRTDGICNISDLGCGDAALATALQTSLKKLKLKVYSFDLHSSSPLVTRADIADLPLADGNVDVAIFCLALMGTNWIDFVEEAFRILRWKGELWVAEIKSRFGRVSKARSKIVGHSVGKRNRSFDDKKDRKKRDEGDEALLTMAIDGTEEKSQETDLSAFVEVLRKRGFSLRGNTSFAVDLSNKMFVKMCFVKNATPVKGRHVPIPKGMKELGLATWQKRPKDKVLEGEQVSSEAQVLKPCVYKLR